MEMSVQNLENCEISTLPFNTITLPPDKLSPFLKAITRNDIQVINLDELQNQQVIIIINNNEALMQQDTNSIENTADINAPIKEDNPPHVDDTRIKPKTVKKPKTIKCFLCQITFENLTRYRFHMKQHQSSKKYHCNFCPQSYNKEANYKIHMTFHSSGPPKCPICERQFQRFSSLKSHLTIHSVEESYSCLYCKAEYNKEDELYKHLEIHEADHTDITVKEVPLRCNYCNYVFNDVAKYKKHIQLHIQARRIVNSRRTRLRHWRTREYAHKCQDCSKSFPKLCLLERHRRTHTGEKPFLCTICKRGFSQKSALSIHQKRHEGHKAHECMFCPAKFIQKCNLIAHLEKTHTSSEPDDKVYKCTHCTCVFKKVSSLNGHVTRVHSDCAQEGDAIMNVISQLKALDKQSSSILKDLKETSSQQQITTNSADNVFKSPEVSYVKVADSSVNGVLRTYSIKQRVVGDIRLYVCSDCNKEFKKPSDLIRHMRIHTKEKPYKCPECDQRFAQKSTVTNHMATHYKNDFECVNCKKSFSSTRSLNAHLKKHEPSVVAQTNYCYQCSDCDKTFDSLEAANIHMSLHDTPDQHLLIADKQDVPKSSLLQPLIETNQGLFPIPPPKPKVPLATLDEYKDRPFKCETCNAAFGRAAHLKKHLVVHSTNKEFLCSICSKQFGTAAALKEHLSYHKRPRSHVCSECNKGFINASMLQRHIISHKTTKLYVCPYCKKRFRAKEHCRKHIARHNISSTSSAQIKEENQVRNVGEGLQQSVICLNSLIDGNVYTKPNSEVVDDDSKEDTSVIENVSIIDASQLQNIPQIHIQEGRQWLCNLEDIQLLDNVETGLQQNSEILMNSDLQTNYDLSASNIVLGLDGQINIDNESFASNMIYNTAYNELDNVPTISKVPQFTTDVGSVQEQAENNAIETNLSQENVLVNDAVENDIPKDINYFDISIRDLLDVRPDNLQENVDNNEISIFICTTCNGKINSLHEEHICSIANTEFLKDNEPTTNETVDNIEANHESCMGDNVAENNIDGLISCPKCSRQFSDVNSLNRHVSAKHKSFVNHMCQFCTKKFKKKTDMDRHIRTHTGEKPFTCSKCDKSFAIKSTLMSHLRTHNPTDFKAFQCKVCSCRFSTAKSLRIHLRIHGDKQEFRCTLCSKTFTRRHHLDSHMSWHEKQEKSNRAPKMSAVNLLQSCLFYTNEKIHEAQAAEAVQVEAVPTETLFSQELQNFGDNMDPVTITLDCNSPLAFKIEDNMLVPSKPADYLLPMPELNQTQNKEKKFQCEICLKNYVSNSVLRKHMRVLHGDYKCDKCNRAFKSMELLEKHYITHDGHRPFNCNMCTNSFFTEAGLKVHLKRMH